MATKEERIREFIGRLSAAPPASSADEAFHLLGSILDAVEDEMTNIPNNPALWMTDGRMYPPQNDAERKATGKPPGWRRYRSLKHDTFVGPHGEIEIWEIGGRCLINKPGAPRKNKGRS